MHHCTTPDAIMKSNHWDVPKQPLFKPLIDSKQLIKTIIKWIICQDGNKKRSTLLRPLTAASIAGFSVVIFLILATATQILDEPIMQLQYYQIWNNN